MSKETATDFFHYFTTVTLVVDVDVDVDVMLATPFSNLDLMSEFSGLLPFGRKPS